MIVLRDTSISSVVPLASLYLCVQSVCVQLQIKADEGRRNTERWKSNVYRKRAEKRRFSLIWTGGLLWMAIFDGRPMQMSGRKAIHSDSYQRSNRKMPLKSKGKIYSSKPLQCFLWSGDVAGKTE